MAKSVTSFRLKWQHKAFLQAAALAVQHFRGMLYLMVESTKACTMLTVAGSGDRKKAV